MGFETPKIESPPEGETPPTDAEPEERLIAQGPKLRYLTKALELLRPEQDPLGGKIKWKELYKEVKPYENGLELSDNVREVVRGFVEKKIPKLKEKAPTIHNLPDRELLNALAHGWFEEIGEEVEGSRREVLLAVMAHVVKRIETYAYRKILENASDSDLEKLGLDSGLRDLLIKLLETSTKADPLFIRFLAYAGLSCKPPEEASSVALFLPDDPRPHTIGELFPKETRFMAGDFAAIAEKSEAWIDKPGGRIFKEYLQSLSALYRERDPSVAATREKEMKRLFGEVIKSNFPILMSPAYEEGYYKEPYTDPELKISISTPDAKREENYFKQPQRVMAESLTELNVAQFEEAMKKRVIRSTMVLGAYGVNLTFNAVAEEDPEVILYLNEQMRAYDRNFPNFMGIIENTEREFRNLNPEERISLMEKISRTNTVLHELGHPVHPNNSPEARRLGRVPLTKIEDVKAEIIYRALTPSIIEKGGLEGTKEQWAIGMTASSLQLLRDHPEDDPYYHAAVYALNDLFDKGVAVFRDNKIEIQNFDQFYQIQKALSEEVIALYESPTMTESKAARWVKKRCRPNEKVKRLESFMKDEFNY